MMMSLIPSLIQHGMMVFIAVTVYQALDSPLASGTLSSSPSPAAGGGQPSVPSTPVFSPVGEKRERSLTPPGSTTGSPLVYTPLRPRSLTPPPVPLTGKGAQQHWVTAS